MFIIDTISKEEAQGEVKEIYEKMEESLGFIPPHTNLFATLDLQGLQEFFKLNIYLQNHNKIDAKLLPFIRLYIASSECRNYCKSFNTKLLLASGVKRNLLKNIVEQFDEIPFEVNQKTLAKKIIRAIYESEQLNRNDLEELYKYGFSDKDFYDLLNYATIFMAKSKIIETYLKR